MVLTGWRSDGSPTWLRILGWILVGSGAAVLLEAFGRFVIEGIGTPAPVAPTEKLVVGGLYRFVRNPMYLAVAAVILGQAAVLGRWVLVVYAVAFGVIVWSFVWYEEPLRHHAQVVLARLGPGRRVGDPSACVLLETDAARDRLLPG